MTDQEKNLNEAISAYKEGISIIDKDHNEYNIDIDLVGPEWCITKGFRLFDEDMDFRKGDILQHKVSEHILRISAINPSGKSFIVNDLTYIMEMVKDQSKAYKKHNMVNREDIEFLFNAE